MHISIASTAPRRFLVPYMNIITSTWSDWRHIPLLHPLFGTIYPSMAWAWPSHPRGLYFHPQDKSYKVLTECCG
ncbi:hypothetical protein VTN00DRAFT_6089 [Thermoascus crustaceus]|uniref:uncharacterized protein n=1 Tax=Thermoascus crustaceus TaxID=5088 RepID=UPI00374290D5